VMAGLPANCYTLLYFFYFYLLLFEKMCKKTYAGVEVIVLQ